MRLIDRRSIRRIRQIARASLQQVLEGSSRVAFVNYPDIGNVGDPALWLGTMRLLEHLGIHPFLHVPIGELDGAAVDRLRTADAILINGGGNFGDLWAGQQQTREQVLEACSKRRIVQLPQSCWFRQEDNLKRMGGLIDRADDVTMMWRDERSLAFAQSAFPGAHISAPDMAYGLRAVSRECSLDVLGLIRSDQESRFPGFDWGAHEIAVTDWTTDPLPEHPDLASTRERMKEMLSEGVPGSTVQPLLLDVARWRVQRGFDILGAGHVVVTDRLHGHIMSLLLGRPHVIVDNSYGKISDLYRTWSDGIGASVIAGSPQHALDMANRMLISS